jgi:hypothetical protein
VNSLPFENSSAWDAAWQSSASMARRRHAAKEYSYSINPPLALMHASGAVMADAVVIRPTTATLQELNEKILEAGAYFYGLIASADKITAPIIKLWAWLYAFYKFVQWCLSGSDDYPYG